jgi:16S rRNA (adenine1518-N6/adenine1519-N6)-dimethyltransferase
MLEVSSMGSEVATFGLRVNCLYAADTHFSPHLKFVFFLMPLTRRQTLAELAKISHRPRKLLGQNYLVDGNIVSKSLELAQVGPKDEVLEVGPGLGTLTRGLLERGARVWAVEFDSEMVAYLEREILPGADQRFDLVQADAVKVPRARMPNHVATRDFKIVANLPYAISTPWMDAILRGPLPARMVLMLQRETADRFAAVSGSKKFGAISIALRSAFDVLKGHPVPRGCFHPAPKVDSYLLNLKRKPTPFVFSDAARDLMRILFQHRRKQIGSLVKQANSAAGIRWLERLATRSIDSRTRPEDLPLAAWQELQFYVDEASAASS